GPQDLLDAPARIDWRLAHIGPASRFQRAPHGRMEIGTAKGDGTLPLRFVIDGERPSRAREGGGLAISTPTLPLLRWIEAHDGAPFTAAQAFAAHGALPQGAMQEVLRVCVQAQYLRLLWYPGLDSA